MLSALLPPDSHHLKAAIGWLELGNPTEAGQEIARIQPSLLDHPEVLEVRWQICAASQSWQAGLEIAEQIVAKAPEQSSGWLHRAYCLRRVPGGGLSKAWEALRPAVEKFPTVDIIPYNLACYAAQSGDPEQAWQWFRKALENTRSLERMKAMALADADLETLWPRIRKI